MSIIIFDGDKIFLKLIADNSVPFFSLRLEYVGDILISAILNGEPLNLGENL